MSIRKDLRRYTKWVVVTVYHSCGCCHSNMLFKNEDSMRAVESTIPRCSVGAKVTDDLGDEFDHIDTFFGGSHKLVRDVGDDEQVEKVCQAIADKLAGKDRNVGYIIDAISA